jgi:hypothetical protein
MATNKKLIWIGIGSALLIGGGIFWWWKNKNASTTNDALDKSDSSKKTDDKSIAPSNNAPVAKDLTYTAPKVTVKTNDAKGFSNGSLVYLKPDNASIYSYPEFKGDYIIGSVSKVQLLDKPFAKFIENTGKGFIKIETIAFTPKCPPNARCTNQLQPKKEVAYISEQFVSNKPY